MRSKPLIWAAGALNELSQFPAKVRDEVQAQLELIQEGGLPHNWKALDQIESGVRELRIRCAEGQFRAFFISKFAEGIYVLRCAVKKNAALSTAERRGISLRYKSVQQIRRQTIACFGETA